MTTEESVRPALLSDVDLHEAVNQVRETPDLWRVYRSEWLIMCASASQDLALRWWDEHYAGRVREEDSKIEYDGKNWMVSAFLPNLKGEFKTFQLAADYVLEHDWPTASIVARSSRDEFKLKDYGKRKLVPTKPD